MALTGWALPVVLALVALTCFLLLVAGRPRGKGWRSSLARGAQAATMCVTAIAVCGLVLNDQYLFYVSWGDLLPAGSVVSYSISAGAPGVKENLPPAITALPAGATLPALPSQGRQLQTYVVTGATSHLTGEVLVYLPRAYNPKARTQYPVIEALHGWPGGPTAVNHEINLTTTFQGLVDARRLAAPIVVMPQIDIPVTLDTECVDAPPGKGPQTMTWLGTDVPNWTASHFRIVPKRTSWLILGASYGGWCAANVGMHYPRTFGGAVSFMGYDAPEFVPDYEPFKNDPAGVRTYELTHLARHIPLRWRCG